MGWVRLENGKFTTIRLGFCTQQYFACRLDDRWLERLYETSYRRIQNSLAARPGRQKIRRRTGPAPTESTGTAAVSTIALEMLETAPAIGAGVGGAAGLLAGLGLLAIPGLGSGRSQPSASTEKRRRCSFTD